MDLAYEEKMSAQELAHIDMLLKKEQVGYFKLLRLLAIVAFSVIGVVALITFLVQPENELEEQFSFLEFFYAALATLLFLSALVIYGKKRFSKAYKLDLKDGIKVVLPLAIQQKQFLQMSQTYHLHLNLPGLNSIEVSQADFLQFEAGQNVHVELAKYSKTYLGYF